MIETPFTRLVGCPVPLQLAGMGSVLSPELTAAVSDAGGLGQITFAGRPSQVVQQRLDRIRSLTSRPFGVNLLIPYLGSQILELALRPSTDPASRAATISPEPAPGAVRG